MKYCADCGSEYQREVETCVDCGTAHWLTAEEHRVGAAVHGETADSRLVEIGTAEDPLTAQQLVGALEAENIPVYSRPRRFGTVGPLTSGVNHPWWELLVPQSDQSRAMRVLEIARSQLEATREEAIQAAEEEASAPPP